MRVRRFPLMLIVVFGLGGIIYFVRDNLQAKGVDVSGHTESVAVTEPRRFTGAFEKSGDEELRAWLSEMQYKVTRRDGTEPAFRNAYWNNKRAGIYVDIVSGEPLFSSLEKFDAGTGWPSFSKPLEGGYVIEKTDRNFGMRRVEVRSRLASSHLGHVFDREESPTGLRYCINSAALRFVPVGALESEGYGEYAFLFVQEEK